MAYPDALVRTKNWGTEVLTDADLESQLDLIIAWIDAHADETDGHKHDGTTNEGPKILASNIGTGAYPAANVAAIANFLNFIYPVGYVITLGVSTNPGTLLGVGTWTAIKGKVIVGISDVVGDTEFDTLNETGGAKTVTLTAAQSGVPAHTHPEAVYKSAGGSGVYNGTGATTETATIDANTPANAAEAHTNLQPYIVKYVWERTA
jgi:hypothetical protein